MLLEAIRLLLAVAIVVVLPGWLLVRALFPRRDALRPSEQMFFALAGGVLLAMIVGIVLGFLPHGGRGALQSIPVRGMPNVELAMIGVSLGLFWVGVRRGAFPVVAVRFPRFATPPPAPQAEEQRP